MYTQLSTSQSSKHFGKLKSVPKSTRVIAPKLKAVRKRKIAKTVQIIAPKPIVSVHIEDNTPVYKGYQGKEYGFQRYNQPSNAQVTTRVYGM
jgi:hypothetical protein